MSKRFLLVPTMLLALLLAAGQASAYTVQHIYERVSATCGEALTIGQLAALKDADGYAYKADANDSTVRPALGVVTKGCAAAGTAEIATRALVSGWTSLAEGAPGYLSETAGAVTQTRPVYGQQVGMAISSTQYMIEPQSYVDPTAGYSLDVDNVVLTAADCGETHAIATDAKTYTLPATIAGCEYTFINAGAAGNNIVELVPAAADQIFGTVTLAASVVTIAGAAGEHVVNTKASSTRGNTMVIKGDGADGWYIKSSTGIWAEATP